MKAYLANGLFSIGDRIVNEKIAHELRNEIKGIDLYVPQENDSINDKTNFADSLMIAEADSEKLIQSDVLVAVIDGVEIDSGVAAEIGLFSSLNRPIIALCTDIRAKSDFDEKKFYALSKSIFENQYLYRNLFVIGLIKQNGIVVNSIEELVSEVKKHD